MNKLEISQIELINGGTFIEGFCDGFQAGVIIYGAGLLANLWNPVGWGASAIAIAVGAGCYFV